MASVLQPLFILSCLLCVAHCGAASLPGLDEWDGLSDSLKDLLPHELFDGSYLDGLVELVSGWRVSDLSFGSRLGPSQLLSDIDTGDFFGGDFLQSLEDQFDDHFAFTMDRVTGLFEGEQSELSDYLRSPVDKFEKHFGMTDKCSGPGFICGEKIPDACTGPSYSFVIDGGVCVIDEKSGEVVCSRPSVSIVKIPATCNLKYESSTTVLVDVTSARGYSCVEKREFGETKTKTVGKKGRTLDLKAGEPHQFFDLDDLPFDLSMFFD